MAENDRARQIANFSVVIENLETYLKDLKKGREEQSAYLSDDIRSGRVTEFSPEMWAAVMCTQDYQEADRVIEKLQRYFSDNAGEMVMIYNNHHSGNNDFDYHSDIWIADLSPKGLRAEKGEKDPLVLRIAANSDVLHAEQLNHKYKDVIKTGIAAKMVQPKLCIENSFPEFDKEVFPNLSYKDNCFSGTVEIQPGTFSSAVDDFEQPPCFLTTEIIAGTDKVLKYLANISGNRAVEHAKDINIIYEILSMDLTKKGLAKKK